MNPERWDRLKALFAEALTREASDRAAFVASLSGEDASVRTALLSLLDAHQEDDFLESPAFRMGSQPADADQPPPARVGPYAVVREIGRGGMGTVYLGVRADDEYEKKVAIKLVRGGFGQQDLRRRFRSERQILARLDHPNIAKLLDGGTTPDGTPYLVMDHVEGEPITAWAEKRSVPIAERLALFRSVCAAVQYAHQNLVVHRDLKPANVLVTPEGVPKLLDFGVAKLLDPQPAETGDAPTVEAMRAMTPDYASPEQARGEPVTILSDVYSLGVVLYELLSGQRPYKVTGTSAREIERVLCEQDPPRPSAKRPHLSADVDAIVLKAMSKEPERRYGSVEQFSADIGRYLDGAPVIARRSTAGYRLRRFAGRHKAVVSVAALLVLSLVLGVVGTTREARIADAQRKRAEKRFADVRKLANSLLFDIYGAVENLPGATAARQAIVTKALEYLRSLAQEAGDDAGLKRELAEAYQRVGDIQGSPFVANLGDTAGALASFRTALDIREALLAKDPGNVELARARNSSFDKISDVLSYTGDVGGALAELRRSQEGRERLAKEHPDDPKFRRDVAVGHLKLADVLSRTGNIPGALASMTTSRDILEAIAGSKPDDMRARRDLSVARNKLAEMLRLSGDLGLAATVLAQAIEDSKAILAREPDNAIAKRDLEISANKLGLVKFDAGDAAGAVAAHREALATAEALAAADALNKQGRMDIAFTENRLGRAQEKVRDSEGAMKSFRTANSVLEALLREDAKNSQTANELAKSLEGVARVLGGRGDFSGARPLIERALALREKQAVDDPKDVGVAEALAATRDLARRLSGRPR